MVLGRHAEQIGDDQEGERFRVVLEEFALAAPMNLSSCLSAKRHMKSSFSLSRLGVMSLFNSPRVRV